jgi:hypothetical protein
MPYLTPDRYIKVVQAAQIPIRIRLIRLPVNTVNGRDLAEGRDLPRRPAGLPLLTVDGISWNLDGTPFEWGEALRGTYRDRPDCSGRLHFPASEIAAMVQESLQSHDHLTLQCSGDRPAEMAFDAMDTMQGVDWPAQRVRIEHGDGIVNDLIPRARRLGVVVVQNPAHLAFDMIDIDRARFGADTPFFPLRSLLEGGVHLAIGSDGPLNPYLNIMFAVLNPVHPDEALTREQAVIAYTHGSAFAEFTEQDKGTITPGKLADIAVLSQDIFTVPVDTLPATESILTLVGGNIVYDAGVLAKAE